MPDKFTLIQPNYNSEIAKEIEQQTMKVMHEYMTKMERSLELQDYCFYCLKDRPELLESLKKEEWCVVNKTPSIEERLGSYVIVAEAWWACKDCQLGGYQSK